MKYTSDGKKVAVIGKLNATESIVQEIFVRNDGSEIPSGEQFVVKSLHDEPVKSWKETRKEELEKQLVNLEQAVNTKNNLVRQAQRLADFRVKALNSVATAAMRESLDTLGDFVAGRITHVVKDREYGDCSVMPFESAIEDKEGGNVEGIKLLSLFGKSDGTLQWRIHQYGDHSGGTTIIIPAKGLDDARRIVQELFTAEVMAWRTGHKNMPPLPEQYHGEGKYHCDLGLVVPQDVAEFWVAKKAEQRASKIAALQEQLRVAMEK